MMGNRERQRCLQLESVGIRVLSALCQQHIGLMRGPVLGQIHKSEGYCRSQSQGGRVWATEGGSREETENVHSAQLDAIVQLNRGKLETTKNKQPQAPWGVLHSPYPISHSALWSPVGHSSCEQWQSLRKMKWNESAYPFICTLMHSSACHLT